MKLVLNFSRKLVFHSIAIKLALNNSNLLIRYGFDTTVFKVFLPQAYIFSKRFFANDKCVRYQKITLRQNDEIVPLSTDMLEFDTISSRRKLPTQGKHKDLHSLYNSLTSSTISKQRVSHQTNPFLHLRKLKTLQIIRPGLVFGPSRSQLSLRSCKHMIQILRLERNHVLKHVQKLSLVHSIVLLLPRADIVDHESITDQALQLLQKLLLHTHRPPQRTPSKTPPAGSSTSP